jgi:ABC-2 type transport system permease protein
MLTYWWQVYRANLRASWAMMAQYRMVVLIWALWGFVGPLVSLAVWSATASAHGGPVGQGGASFTTSDFAAYFLLFMIYGHITMSWDVFEFAYRVRTGSLSPKLLRPLHPIHEDAASNIGFKLFTTTLLIPIWAAIYLMLRPSPPTSYWWIPASLPSLALAAVMRYVLQYVLAILSFWTTRIDAVNQLYFTLDSFLSGRVAPLALLPGGLAAAAQATPFRYMGSFPVEVALGKLTPHQVLTGMAVQVAWLVAVLLLLHWTWRAGVRQYSAAGA